METLRIAVATSDGRSVCSHLARSSEFIIVDVNAGRPVSRTIRPRFTEACGNHAGFVELLRGCDLVLCGGIGQGAVDSLEAQGIRPLVVVGPHSADEAIDLYLLGKLPTSRERVCLCH